jgi:1-acyl-sn-glycerol-3-phosphate acyltransferase
MAPFKAFFCSQFLGAFNDNVFKNALVILITFYSVEVLGLNAQMLVPLAGGIFIFPFFIFSGTAGQISDKYSRVKLVKIIKFCEIIIMLLAALGFYLDSFEFLLGVLFLMGGQSAFFGPVKYGIIPSLVEKDKLVSANAIVSGGTFVAILLGTILGGSLGHDKGSYQYISIVIIVIAVFGFISSLLIKEVDTEEKKGSSEKVDITFIKSTYIILKQSLENKELFLYILGVSWFWFLGASVLSLIPIMVKDIFLLDSTMATFFLALFTIGMGLGSYFINKVSKDGAQIGLVPICSFAITLILILCFVSLTYKMVYLAMLSIVTLSLFGGGFIVTYISILQEKTPPKILSRIIAGNNIWNACFMVAAAVFVMLSVKMFSIEVTVLILGFISLTVSLLLYVLYQENAGRQLMRLAAFLGYDVEIIGKENVPTVGSFLLVGNHVSFVDWVFVMASSPRPVRFVIDHAYYYKKPISVLFKHAKLIPIATKKQSEEMLLKAFDNINKTLEEGHVLGIFAEGWLTRDGQMRALQPGVNKILKRSPVPVVLVSLDGLWGSFFSHEGPGVLKGGSFFKRRKVTVTFSKPIRPSDYDRIEAGNWFKEHVSHYDT